MTPAGPDRTEYDKGIHKVLCALLKFDRFLLVSLVSVPPRSWVLAVYHTKWRVVALESTHVTHGGPAFVKTIREHMLQICRVVNVAVMVAEV
jgi:hypothetical protein